MPMPVPPSPPLRVPARRSLGRDALWMASLALAYFLAVELGLHFPFAPHILAPVWPAGGVALAALLIAPRRLWPAILLILFLTDLAADLLAGWRLLQNLGFAAVNVVAALACGSFIRYRCGASVRFARVKEVLTLIFCVTAVNACTSFLGARVAAPGNSSPFGSLWTTLWISDGLGMLLIAPLILAWQDLGRRFRLPRWDRMFERILFMSIWCAAVLVVSFADGSAHPYGAYFGAFPYMLVALICWPALRFGQRTVTLALLVLGALVFAGKTVSTEPLLWASGSQLQRLLAVQVYLAFLAATGLLLSACFTEAVSATRSAQEAHARLRALADHIPNGWVYEVLRERDGSVRFLYGSSGIESLTGVTAEEVVQDATVLPGLIVEEDRMAFAAAEQAANRQMRVFDIELRQRRRDGQVRWMHISASPRHLADGRTLWDGLQMDITTRKTAEARLRDYEKVVEGVPEQIAVIDRQYQYLIANQAFLAYRGLRREQVVGHLVSELLGQDAIATLTKGKMDECFAGHVVNYERELTFPALGRRDILASYFPIEGPAGVDRIAMVLEDITERKRAERVLQRSFEQLHALTAQLQSLREQERATLARELHDRLGQSLTAVKIDLAALKTMPGRDQQRQRIDDLSGLLDQTIHSVRRISTELRPGILDDLGLVAALEWGAEEFQARTGIDCLLSVSTLVAAIDAEAATALFRIFQETLTNIAQYAGATRVRAVLFEDSGHLTLEIRDNGRGIREDQLSAACSLGILGMRERASLLGGDLTFGGDAESGTLVRVRIPTDRRKAVVVG
jgi:PAS domain S-box-containing protein